MLRIVKVWFLIEITIEFFGISLNFAQNCIIFPTASEYAKLPSQQGALTQKKLLTKEKNSVEVDKREKNIK